MCMPAPAARNRGPLRSRQLEGTLPTLTPSAARSRRAVRVVAVIAASVAAATALVAVVETSLGLVDASVVYLVAVVVSAMLAGSVAGVGTAVTSVVTYDLLFTQPTFALEITDRSEWLSLLLFSFVGITVGQLVAIQRRHTDEALEREREAHDLYAVSRHLATRTSTEAALDGIARILADRSALERVWVGVGAGPGHERIVADTGGGPIAASPTFSQLRRSTSGDPREWVLIHTPGQRPGSAPRGKLRHRVVIEAEGSLIGSLWGERDRAAPSLDPSASRLLAAVADQVGQAIYQDRLAVRAAEARIAQASDALKSVLVENVSHDLRIPLAAIRADAGPLIDPAISLSPGQVREAALAIDRQAAKLDRLVANLLDLGRIQGGMLQAHREAVELREVVTRAAAGLADDDASGDGGGSVEIQLQETWVDADPVLLQQALANVLENARRHTPQGTRILVTAAREDAASSVRLSVDDAGPGVSEELLPMLFERFFRNPSSGPSRRPGSGIGLAIARGFVEAMGGRIAARRSDLGGLAIDIRLPATVLPPELMASLAA